jgi:peptidyl-tRNA hydrolase
MASIGQTIVIRTDLFDLPKDTGLLTAQVAHVHMELTRRLIQENFVKDEDFIGIKLPEEGELGADFMDWIDDPYIFVKGVQNIEALNHFEAKSRDAKLPTFLWTDTIYVRLTPTKQEAMHKVPVGFSIGPADADKMRAVVGDLPLL